MLALLRQPKHYFYEVWRLGMLLLLLPMRLFEIRLWKVWPTMTLVSLFKEKVR